MKGDLELLLCCQTIVTICNNIDARSSESELESNDDIMLYAAEVKVSSNLMDVVNQYLILNDIEFRSHIWITTGSVEVNK